MDKIAIISSADSKYFPMLRELVESIRAFPQSAGIDICVIDTGLTPEEKAALLPHVVAIKDVDWPCAIPARRIRGREFLKACVTRPFIPETFPGYEVYIWLDSDTWVQDWAAIALLILGARLKGLAIVPQSDRAYGKTMRLSWLGPLPWKPHSFYYNNAKRAFSSKIARALFPFPTINAGVFAMTGDAPHWKRWQELIVQALCKGRVFTAEQLTLGMMIYLEKAPVELLPAWCNWLCETKPLWDPARGKFVEPYLPRADLGIVHLSGMDAMRVDRGVTEEFRTTENGTVRMSYRYPRAAAG